MPDLPRLTLPQRNSLGSVIFVEDFSDNFSGMYNDGCGSAAIDNNIRFNGKPSVRLDTQNNSSTGPATGGNQQMTLSGTGTYTPISNGVLNATSTQAGALTLFASGYIVLNTPATVGNWPTSDGNSYVLTYTAVAIGGSTGAWTAQFTGVNLLQIPGRASDSVTTANSGVAVIACCNPNPNCTGSPLTTGVVYKRRILDQMTGRYAVSFWFRPTSQSAASSFTSLFVSSIYNRDGSDFWGGRHLIQTAVGMNPSSGWSNDNQLHWLTTGTSAAGVVFMPFALTKVSAMSQHSWDPVNGTWDLAGGWHFMKIAVDFAAKTYLYIQFNEQVYNSMAGTPLYRQIGVSGAKMMHFSVEFAQAQSATRRFWNVAQIMGTQEP